MKKKKVNVWLLMSWILVSSSYQQSQYRFYKILEPFVFQEEEFQLPVPSSCQVIIENTNMILYYLK